jgi:predicted amidohydrolase
MKIALAQMNPIVGDIAGNTAAMAELIDRAKSAGAELVVFSELSIVGYPPRDLLRKDRFVADNLRALDSLAGRCVGIAALVGFVQPTPGQAGRPLQNAAALLADGHVRHVHVKSLLPTYDVFDETRYFEPGVDSGCIEIAGKRAGLTICEDLWDAQALGRAMYGPDPIARLMAAGAQVIINMAASPYQMGKVTLREELFGRQARRANCPLVYVNQVGGNERREMVRIPALGSNPGGDKMRMHPRVSNSYR